MANKQCLALMIASLPLPTKMPDVLDEVATMYAGLSGADYKDAETWTGLKIQAAELSAQKDSLGKSLIHQWRWDSTSLWSGHSAEARNIVGIAHSILANGFWQEESICSRDAVWGLESLRFGDGMKRGLASKLVWVLMRKAISDGMLKEDPEAVKVFSSLVGLPTLYEQGVDLVKQAVRQNVRGTYIQPLSCLQWANLAILEKYPSLSSIGQDNAQLFSWDDPCARREVGKGLCAKLDELLSGFHAQVDSEGLVVEAPKKKQRRGRRAQTQGGSQMPVEETSEIKIGTQKQQAIKNVLMGCTPESFRMMCCHLSNFVGGGEKRSALTPEVLAWRHLWPMSPVPDGQAPSEAEEVARRSAAGVTKRLLPDRVM